MSIPPVSLDIEAWTAFYKAMHDQLVTDLALSRSDMRDIPEGEAGNTAATWNTSHTNNFYRLLELSNLIVKKLDQDQPLLDFLRQLKEAHENETKTREALR